MDGDKYEEVKEMIMLDVNNMYMGIEKDGGVMNVIIKRKKNIKKKKNKKFKK
jgi:molecular chaperone DnaK (HSP70)